MFLAPENKEELSIKIENGDLIRIHGSSKIKKIVLNGCYINYDIAVLYRIFVVFDIPEKKFLRNGNNF